VPRVLAAHPLFTLTENAVWIAPVAADPDRPTAANVIAGRVKATGFAAGWTHGRDGHLPGRGMVRVHGHAAHCSSRDWGTGGR